jgi:dihydrodipicolinate synthase/N-acetylneuraminate lyase
MSLGTLRGVIAAIATPFNQDGSLNLETLERLTDLLIQRGVHGIMAAGGTGEFPSLSEKERLQVAEAIVRAARGRAVVFANTTACATEDAVRLAHGAAETGADAIISVPPYYFPLSEAALRGYFVTLADRSPLPLFIYNNPGYTGNPMPPALLVDLLQHPNILGLKQSESDLGQLVEVIYQIRTVRRLDKALMTGIDSQFCAALGTGAHGIFSTAAGIVPERMVEIFDLAMAGDFKAAHVAQLRLQPLNRFLEYDPGYVAPAKEALRILGIEAGDPRPPLPLLTESERAGIRDALAGLGALSGVR